MFAVIEYNGVKNCCNLLLLKQVSRNKGKDTGEHGNLVHTQHSMPVFHQLGKLRLPVVAACDTVVVVPSAEYSLRSS